MSDGREGFADYLEENWDIILEGCAALENVFTDEKYKSPAIVLSSIAVCVKGICENQGYDIDNTVNIIRHIAQATNKVYNNEIN